MTIQETGHDGESLSDEAVLSFAAAEERTLVTLNRRHFVRLHAVHPVHAGIIVCSLDSDFVALAARVDAVLRDGLPMPGRLTRVNRPT
jgi:predicted nuclease of predicted toxin-antitoxin system